MKLKNKNILVYGLGKSGIGAIKLLKKQKAKIFVYDDNFNNLNSFNDNSVCKVQAITENFLEGIHLIVVNPSVSKYSENLKLAFIKNVKIISEIELAYLFKKGKIISVTGSNGKSTTSTLIYNIFKQANLKTSLVGNIGNSFCEEVAKNKKQHYIVEVSSFQLETIDKYKSDIACFLNFSENHLDRHFSLKNYFETKCEIFKNSTKKDYKILNYDDEKVRYVKTNSNTYFFSCVEVVKGTYVNNGQIYFNNGKTTEKILSVDDIKLIGEHNLQNVLCAVLVAKLNKIKNEYIKKAVQNFYGINHRIEYVDEINGIKFYNDSKSTTCKATLTALNCFKNNNVLLILGGSDKGFGFEEIFKNLPSCVKNIICLGEVKDKILLEAKKHEFFNIYESDSFINGIYLSKQLASAENLDIVLLSPATASFDMFQNFEERGDTFKNLIKEIKSEN